MNTQFKRENAIMEFRKKFWESARKRTKMAILTSFCGCEGR